MNIPAQALSQETILTITDGGIDLQLTTEGAVEPAVNIQIGPDGTEFQVPVAITLQWLDVNNDGIVDDLNLNELDLHVFKDGEAIAGPCSTDTRCDPAANTFTVEVESLSHFVLGVLAAPEIQQITGPLAPVKSGISAQLSAIIKNSEISENYTVTWDWKDGSTTTETVSETTLTASHTYTQPGVFAVSLTVQEEELDPVTAIYEFVVVYDPTAGFVTGGGWFTSPAGAYKADETLEGKATFGFVSRYKKGKTIPDGNTEFQFKAGGLNFHSESYEWLVVNQASSRAQYKGKGTINGASAPNGSPYKFMIWAIDGSPDTFRIKIWWEDGAAEQVVYDNGVDQAIGGGSIVVHK